MELVLIIEICSKLDLYLEFSVENFLRLFQKPFFPSSSDKNIIYSFCLNLIINMFNLFDQLFQIETFRKQHFLLNFSLHRMLYFTCRANNYRKLNYYSAKFILEKASLKHMKALSHKIICNHNLGSIKRRILTLTCHNKFFQITSFCLQNFPSMSFHRKEISDRKFKFAICKIQAKTYSKRMVLTFFIIYYIPKKIASQVLFALSQYLLSNLTLLKIFMHKLIQCYFIFQLKMLNQLQKEEVLYIHKQQRNSNQNNQILVREFHEKIF
ncbi:unnamed protein product (macronuclear) [Paramecium tetraurelia]|uniref:Transmembrane protein n=1 Tax=Paramecium tetraurelia TaxID=5888 RepID=A0E2D0_PARTE|nr:uncharacterized protein GSPATT00022619001 [Paramecium tetraurelia]CAK89447.1 unnamed protein product [Paramecium tetraurelia]|eukprot:XP_001456844.1 hypothetical protein (macronuclear) [Paramecium tetraurelia strain d4-2]